MITTVKNFTVKASTKTGGVDGKNPGFIVKLQRKNTVTVQTVLGSKTTNSQETYYIKMDNDATPFIGKEVPFDLAPYDILLSDYIPEGETEAITCKWLVLKKA